MKHTYSCRLILCCLILLFCSARAFAIVGAVGSHDPASLIKEGNRYWMFTTGDGIYTAYSDDLIRWQSGSKPVFPRGTWPAWINEAVPGFAGHFWAPDIVFMNGKYYVYYSCSTFGSSRSAIGVATSPTLDPNSPNFVWTDLGMMVSSSQRSDINAIDPAILQDADGRVYMSYGSFSGGIGMVELGPTTGLRLANAPITRIAGGNGGDWEAPHVFKQDNYYYLIVNRGSCCRGLNSTYRMVMGRSTNVMGPYLDQAGVDMRNGGGTHLLGTSGRYIGPGHFGLLRENGTDIVTMHYYDGNDNGNPKLDIATMRFTNGWPAISRDWVPAGRYQITNQNSGLAWATGACTGAAAESIIQSTPTNAPCQQWDFAPLGDGVYKITSALEGNLAADVAQCSGANGAKLQLGPYVETQACQKFKLERTSDGVFVFTPLTGHRVVEVPNALTTPGTQLALWDYNGCNCQKWILSPEQVLSVRQGQQNKVSVYPNPSPSGTLTLEVGSPGPSVAVSIFSLTGQLLYERNHANQRQIPVTRPFSPGVYFIKLKTGQGQSVQKWVVGQ